MKVIILKDSALAAVLGTALLLHCPCVLCHTAPAREKSCTGVFYTPKDFPYRQGNDASVPMQILLQASP